MLENFKQSMLQQSEAALSTLKQCVDHCPEEFWERPVCHHTVGQSIFHTLFFADVYFGPDLASLREQAFHRENQGHFLDYEELEDRQPVHSYDRDFIDRYFGHLHDKVIRTLMLESAETLARPCGFDWLPITRMEIYPYNIRHIQHHAAQLILKMRIDGIHDAGWVKSGWPEEP